MVGAGAHFGALPVVGLRRKSRNVAEVMSAPCACASTSRRERNGRIDPVPLQPDIEVAAVLALDLEPVDELVVDLAGVQRVEHLHPGGKDDLRAPLQPARAPLRCARAGRSRVPSSCRRAACADDSARRSSGAARRFEPDAQIARGLERLVAERLDIGFERIERIGVLAARADMLIGRRRGTLRPARARRRRAAATSSLRRPARRTRAMRFVERVLAASRRPRSDRAGVPATRACGCARAPSGPRIQRRRSAISLPESSAAKPQSAASNR